MGRDFQLSTDLLHATFDTGSLNWTKPLSQERSLFMGEGTVNSFRVFFWGTNSDVDHGRLTVRDSMEIEAHLKSALAAGCPVVSFLQSTGISPEDGVEGGFTFSSLAMTCAELSGKIPQLCCLTGVNLGGAGYLAALHDIVIGHKLRSYICISGPEVVKLALGREETFEEMGGMDLQSSVGLVHSTSRDWKNITQELRSLLTLVETARSGGGQEPRRPASDLPSLEFTTLKPFDMNLLLRALVDDSFFWEYSPEFAQNLITAFGYWDGAPVGIIANQSLVLAGAIDAAASRKLSRFIKLCHAYRLPLVILIDTPGFIPGKKSEAEGALQWGANIVSAMQTDVPKMSVVIRRCFGAAGMMLTQSRAWRGDYSIALETISTSVMGKNIISRLGLEFKEDTARTLLGAGIIDEIVALQDIRSKFSLRLKSLPRKPAAGKWFIGY